MKFFWPETTRRDMLKNAKIGTFWPIWRGSFLWGLFTDFPKNVSFLRGGPRHLLKFFEAPKISFFTGNCSSRSLQNRRNQPPRPIFKKATTRGLFGKNRTFWRFLVILAFFGQSGQKMKIFIFLNISNWLGRRLVPCTALRDHAENNKIRYFQSTFDVTPHLSMVNPVYPWGVPRRKMRQILVTLVVHKNIFKKFFRPRIRV